MEMEQIGAIGYIVWCFICLFGSIFFGDDVSYRGRSYVILNTLGTTFLASVLIPIVGLLVILIVATFVKIIITALGY